MRLFNLIRHEDETGVSGTGKVAEGVEFSNGIVVLTWLTEWTSTAVYQSLEHVIRIHGHQGKTTVEWV